MTQAEYLDELIEALHLHQHISDYEHKIILQYLDRIRAVIGDGEILDEDKIEQVFF